MIFGLPFSLPLLSGESETRLTEREFSGIAALLQSMTICVLVGLFFRWIGKDPQKGMLYQKEAMAVVGLSWIFATVLRSSQVTC